MEDFSETRDLLVTKTWEQNLLAPETTGLAVRAWEKIQTGAEETVKKPNTDPSFKTLLGCWELLLKLGELFSYLFTPKQWICLVCVKKPYCGI
ncbi:hypothetical protein OIU77_008355, partial [Salix suchowensis]